MTKYVLWFWIPQWLSNLTLNTPMVMKSNTGYLYGYGVWLWIPERVHHRPDVLTEHKLNQPLHGTSQVPCSKRKLKKSHGTGPLRKVVLRCPFNEIDIPRIFLRSSRGCWGLYRHLSAQSRSRETAERELEENIIRFFCVLSLQTILKESCLKTESTATTYR